ncbi:MAG: aminotransferase class I/II-fold pyridoxal phosphate-dependent enzyme [candidate division Zixibacteria bacterium]|nr:aminotransferase class I/II-fold pyridoxal phosphate-dependent enzyme [candidate division Zixibacteria bacterium]
MAVIVGNREALTAVNFLVQASRLRPLARTVRVALSVLENAESLMAERMERLAASRNILVEALTEVGWTSRAAPTVPFLWVAVPGMVGSEGFSRRLLRRTGLKISPGSIFGVRGEGFVRIAIPPSESMAKIVAERLRSHARLYQRRIPRRNPLRRRGRPDSSEMKDAG